MEELKCQQLPLSPPEAFLRWADRELLGNTHARLYRHARYYDPLTERLVAGVEVTCSACGETAYLGKVPAGGCHQAYPSAPFGFMDINGQSVIHGSHSLCPHCGAQTTAVHIASFRDERIIASCRPLEITAIEGHLVLICWYISRRLNKVGREYLVVFPYEAYVVEHRKISCFKGYIKNQNCLTFTGSWRRVSRYCDCYGELGPVFPWEPGLLAGTTAENSKLELYLRCKGKLFPITYLRLWLRHPNVENLLTCGVGQLLESLLRREISIGTYGAVTAIPTLDTVRWKEKRPAQMLGLNRDVFRALVKQEWSLEEWELYRLYLSWAERLDWERDAVRALLAEAQENANDAIQKARDMTARNQTLREQLARAQKDAERLRKEADSGKVDKARQEGYEKARAELAPQLEAAQKAARTAQEEAQTRTAQAEEATRKKEGLANEEAVAFNLLFKQIQEQFNVLSGYLLKFQTTRPELAAGAARALRAMLRQWGQTVEEKAV